MNIVEFLASIGPADPATGCREWTRARNACGYGILKFGEHQWLAHRLAWLMSHSGTIPNKACILHRCDNPACCEPGHLFTGTPADNVADMRAKGRERKARGQDNGTAKLTEAQVFEIRERMAYSRHGAMALLAREFGVSKTAIRYIMIGRSWRYATGAAPQPVVPSP